MPTGLAMDTTRVLLWSSAVLLAGAALHDVATRTVPNWVSGVLLMAGVALRLIHGHILFSLCCAAAVFIACALCWRRRWMGGADVKLMTVAVLLVSPSHVPDVLLSIALAGGLLVPAYLAARIVVKRTTPAIAPPGRTRGRPSNFLARILRVERRRIRRLASLPYAAAIAMGTIFVILRTV